HVYADDGVDPAQLADVWRRESGAAADVATREEAIGAGLFGEVAEHVRARIGDVLVAARGLWAFYDDRLANKQAQNMIGQHGSVTPEEMTVPLIRLGAYARR
ncbi:MAG: alkaline phosphatase family protein, partial [Microbacterium sp.]